MFLQDPYVMKAAEYLLGIAFLVLFALFWHYATGNAAGVSNRRPHRRRRAADVAVPQHLMVPRGQGWRTETPDVIAAGIEELARPVR